jgi:hypothetical protein
MWGTDPRNNLAIPMNLLTSSFSCSFLLRGNQLCSRCPHLVCSTEADPTYCTGIRRPEWIGTRNKIRRPHVGIEREVWYETLMPVIYTYARRAAPATGKRVAFVLKTVLSVARLVFTTRRCAPSGRVRGHQTKIIDHDVCREPGVAFITIGVLGKPCVTRTWTTAGEILVASCSIAELSCCSTGGGSAGRPPISFV